MCRPELRHIVSVKFTPDFEDLGCKKKKKKTGRERGGKEGGRKEVKASKRIYKTIS